MMCDSKDNDSVWLRPVDDREREFLHEYAASIGTKRGSGQWEGKRTGSRLFNCRGEACAQSGLGFTVVNDLGKRNSRRAAAMNRARLTARAV